MNFFLLFTINGFLEYPTIFFVFDIVYKIAKNISFHLFVSVRRFCAARNSSLNRVLPQRVITLKLLIISNRLFPDTKVCKNVAEYFVGGDLPRDFA